MDHPSHKLNLISLIVFLLALLALTVIGVEYLMPREGRILTKCRGINAMSERDQCLLTQAFTERDAEYCTIISEYSLKRTCVFNLSVYNRGFCEYLDGYDHDLCYLDAEDCSGVSDIRLLKICYNRTGECGKIDDNPMRDSCNTRLGTNDPEYCDRVSDDYMRKRCIMLYSAHNHDQEICTLLDGQENVVCLSVSSRKNRCKSIDDEWWALECERIVDETL